MGECVIMPSGKEVESKEMLKYMMETMQKYFEFKNGVYKYNIPENVKNNLIERIKLKFN